jgi:hypothetical protein
MPTRDRQDLAGSGRPPAAHEAQTEWPTVVDAVKMLPEGVRMIGEDQRRPPGDRKRPPALGKQWPGSNDPR